MSLKDKMANAKEVDLFEDLTQEEKIEAIVEGRLQVAMIKELEKIKVYNDHILNCGMGKKKSIEFINKFIEHHISELKGEQK